MSTSPSPPVIKFYDSLKRRRVGVGKPIGSRLSFYACGITPYAPAHIGHARSFVVFDVMAQALRDAGYQVDLVRNVTDIDDKIIDAARAQSRDWKEFSHAYAARNKREIDQLLVQPYEEPYASEHIEDIQNFIARLIQKNHAYQSSTGDVLFEVESFKGAPLMPHDPEDLLAHQAHRVSSEGKRSPLDFVLWKKSKANEPFWPSPWGDGRPGWHIECSAMVQKRFADTLDYHGGGTDLRFPHHQAEIQQSEAAFDRPLARRWVHHGSVRDGQGRKMSKSLGNTVLLSTALDQAEKIIPAAGRAIVRLALLSSIWTKPLDWWGPTILPQAAKNLQTFVQAAQLALSNQISDEPLGEQNIAHEGVDHKNAIREVLYDNLNTPALFALLHQLSKKALGGDRFASRQVAFGLNLLGVTPKIIATVSAFNDEQSASLKVDELPEPIQELFVRRQQLRAQKDWTGSDALRSELEILGFVVEDQGANTVIRRRAT